MRTANFTECRTAAGFFRLCLGIVVTLTLAVGGMSLNGCAWGKFVISATNLSADNVTECQPFTIDHHLSAVCNKCLPGPANVIFYWGQGNPTWVTVDNITGVISGSADNGTAPGPYNFLIWGTALYQDNTTCHSGPSVYFSDNSIPITINVAPKECVSINPTYYPVAWEGMPFSMPLSATGGVGPLIWSATGLPSNLTVDPVSGIISGIPDPGTYGTYTVTVTCSDSGTCTCCCPPVSAPFTLIVDSYSNYINPIPGSTGCDYHVAIGPGLTAGQTSVLVNGTQQATLGANQSIDFTSDPCQSNLVMVDQTVAGPDPNTSFECIGPNYQMVDATNNYAYFDYGQKVLINTGSDPVGAAGIPGAGSYAVGDNFSASAPSPVDSIDQQGERFLFREWSLPDGSTSPDRDLAFTVTKAGTVTARYDTYYQLNIVSVDPPYNDSSWQLKDSSATYNVALQPQPIPNFWGAIGGVISPVNSSGTVVMTNTKTVNIEWNYDYTVPIIVIVVLLLIIAGVVVFLVLRRKGTGASAVPSATVAQAPQPPADVTETKTTPVATDTLEKKALTEAGSTDKANFCPNCGAPVVKDAAFCKNCGKSLMG